MDLSFTFYIFNGTYKYRDNYNIVISFKNIFSNPVWMTSCLSDFINT